MVLPFYGESILSPDCGLLVIYFTADCGKPSDGKERTKRCQRWYQIIDLFIQYLLVLVQPAVLTAALEPLKDAAET